MNRILAVRGRGLCAWVVAMFDATTTVSASTTATLSFTNFNWNFGIVPFLGLGVITSGSDAGQNSGSFTINSFTFFLYLSKIFQSLQKYRKIPY